MKTIIITGNGQDTKILVRKITNYDVFVFTKQKAELKFKRKNIHYVSIDLLDYAKVKKKISEINPVTIIHLASKNETGFNKKLKYQIHYHDNYLMLKNILQSVSSFNPKIKILFAGSSQMFKKKTGIITEKSKFKAKCYYSRYKIDSHNLLNVYKNNFLIESTTMLLFNHDSIFRNKKFLLPRLKNYFQKKNFKKIREIYTLNLKGDFSHAEDICDAIIKLLNLKKLPKRIILSSNKITKINDLIDYGLKKINHQNLIINLSVKREKDNYLIGNNNKAIKLLNWKIKKNSLLAFKQMIKKI
jgi:GDP-D-mannose dehydratase